MADSIKDLLMQKDFDQPDEISVIKNFVKTKFNEEPSVKITTNSIIVTVKGAALAGALRPELHRLERTLNNNKKIFLRIN